MLNLETLGYKYPVKARLQGNRIDLFDAVNRLIFRPEPYSGGYQGRAKMYAVMEEIARLFNDNHIQTSTGPEAGTLTKTFPDKPTVYEHAEKLVGNREGAEQEQKPEPTQKRRGRPAKAK